MVNVTFMKTGTQLHENGYWSHSAQIQPLQKWVTSLPETKRTINQIKIIIGFFCEWRSQTFDDNLAWTRHCTRWSIAILKGHDGHTIVVHI